MLSGGIPLTAFFKLTGEVHNDGEIKLFNESI